MVNACVRSINVAEKSVRVEGGLPGTFAPEIICKGSLKRIHPKTTSTMKAQTRNTENRNWKDRKLGSPIHRLTESRDNGVSDTMLNVTLFILILFFQCLALANMAYGQKRSMDPVLVNMVNDALLEMNAGNHSAALEKLTTVNGHAPSESFYHLIGVCQFNLGMSMQMAIENLELATENLVDDNQSWDPFCGEAPIHALNYLGKCYFNVGDYERAGETFARFMVSLYVADRPDEWLIAQTELALAICDEMQALTIR